MDDDDWVVPEDDVVVVLPRDGGSDDGDFMSVDGDTGLDGGEEKDKEKNGGKKRMPTLDTAKRVARAKRADLRRNLIIRAHSGHCFLVLCSLRRVQELALRQNRHASIRLGSGSDDGRDAYAGVVAAAMASLPQRAMPEHPHHPPHVPYLTAVPSRRSMPHAGDRRLIAFIEAVCERRGLGAVPQIDTTPPPPQPTNGAGPAPSEPNARGKRGRSDAVQGSQQLSQDSEADSMAPNGSTQRASSHNDTSDAPAEDDTESVLPPAFQRFVEAVDPARVQSAAGIQCIWSVLAGFGYVVRPVIGFRMSCEWTTSLRRVGRFFETAADAAVLGKPPPLFEPPVQTDGKRTVKRAPKNTGSAVKAQRGGKGGATKRKDAKGGEPAAKRQKVNGGKKKAASTSASASASPSPPPAAAAEPGARRGRTANGRGDNLLVLDDDDLFSFESAEERDGSAGDGSPKDEDEADAGGSSDEATDESVMNAEGSDSGEASPSRVKGCPLLNQTVDQLLDEEERLLNGGGQQTIESNAAASWSPSFFDYRPQDPVQAVLKAYDDEEKYHNTHHIAHNYTWSTWWEVLYSDGHFRPLPFDVDECFDSSGIPLVQKSLEYTASRRQEYTYVFTHFMGCFVDLTTKYCRNFMKTTQARVETLDIPKEVNEDGVWERYQVPDGADGEDLTHPERLWLKETLAKLNEPAMVVPDVEPEEDAAGEKTPEPAKVDAAPPVGTRATWVTAFLRAVLRGEAETKPEEATAAGGAAGGSAKTSRGKKKADSGKPPGKRADASDSTHTSPAPPASGKRGAGKSKSKRAAAEDRAAEDGDQTKAAADAAAKDAENGATGALAQQTTEGVVDAGTSAAGEEDSSAAKSGGKAWKKPSAKKGGKGKPAGFKGKALDKAVTKRGADARSKEMEAEKAKEEEKKREPPPPMLPEHVRREIELLRRLRYKIPPPGTHKELTKHPLYAAKTLLHKAEAVVPWAVPYCTNHLYEIYVREDISRLRGREAWRRYGRDVRWGEKAVRRIPAQSGFLSKSVRESGPLEYQNGRHLIDVFGHWQTKVYTAPVNLTKKTISEKAQNSRDREGTFSLADGPLPPNLAHVRGYKVEKLCVALEVPYAKALISFTRHAGWSRPNFDGVVVAKEDEGKVVGAVLTEELKRKIAADEKRSQDAIKRWGRLVFHLKTRLSLHAKYL